ncbi:hypothetical protein [Cellvibrio sp.]|uniref:hypothetical protein n=1 Tax=Cellvibrio sp. TaxID=1965322 RepID=UPI0039647403
MHTALQHLKSIFFIGLFAFITSCSPSEKSNESQQTADTSSTQEAEDPVADDGWRKGTLRIELEITQSGDQNDSVINSTWATAIKATSEEKVMLAPDLRPFVNTAPLKVEDVTQYEPFRQINPDADTVKSSQASHTATWIVSSDGNKLENHGNFVGKVSRVYLQSLHPSLFGNGYDAYLKINLEGNTKTSSSMSGAAAANEQNEKEAAQEIVFILHPVPQDKLNDYSYLPDAMDEEMKKRVIQQNVELLDLLKQTYADSLPVQGDIRAGMKSEATQDKLTMTYEYNGTKQVGYAAMLGVNAGMTKSNKISIKMVLEADK